MFAAKTNYEVNRTSTATSVPNDALSRLRYFISCMCSVIPALNEGGKLNEVIDYQKPIIQNNALINSIIELAKALFIAMNGKCIFQAPELCERGNEFYDIKQINNIIAIADSVVVGGKTQNVTKIMTYKRDWLERNFLNAIRTLELRKMTVVVNDPDCSVM